MPSGRCSRANQGSSHRSRCRTSSPLRVVSKTQRPLPEAERIAAAIVADLAPCCDRIQVAGSVRRRTEVVGDIDVVAIPRYAPAGLFGDCTANLLWEHLHASDAYRFTKGDHPAGRYYQLALPRHAGVQLDLFLAQPDNRGLTLLVHTGSAAFSRAASTDASPGRPARYTKRGGSDAVRCVFVRFHPD